LDDKEEIPKLFNYDGKEYKIKNIMGTFDQNDESKDIVLCYPNSKNKH